MYKTSNIHLSRLYLSASKKLRKISITKRFMMVFVLIIMLPLIIFNIYSSITYKNAVNKKLVTAAQQTIHSFNLLISAETKKYLDFSYTVLTNPKTQEILKRSNEGLNEEAIKSTYGNETNISDIVWTDVVSNMMVLNKSRNVVFSMGMVEIDTSGFSEIIFDMIKSNANHMWFSKKSFGGANHVVFVKKVFSNDFQGDLLGYLIYIFDEKKFFKDIYENLDFGGNSDTFIISNELRYFSSQYDKNKIGTYIFDENIDVSNQLIKNDKGSFIDVYNNRKALFIYEKNKDLDWFVVTAIDQNYVGKEADSAIKNSIILLIIIIIICLILILFICSTIILPVNNLMRYTDRIKNGEYNYDIEDNENDEIGCLAKNNKIMVSRLVKLMEEVKQSEVKKREMELDTLQYQINPHFIFNTLNVFKNIAQINDVYTISDGIEAFSNLLRQTIVNRNEMITIEQEIENLKNYEAIQQYKYICAFEVTYNIEDDVTDYKIPKLLLQPILENSITHGMIDGEILQIDVIVKKENEFIKIIIKDNGRGFDIKESPVNKKLKFSGIGIENIKERIKLIYGEQSGLTICSKQGIGTVVTVYLNYSHLAKEE